MLLSCKITFISSKTAGSSIVDGTVNTLSSAIIRMVFLKILPERVLGNLLTINTVLKAVRTPICRPTKDTESF